MVLVPPRNGAVDAATKVPFGEIWTVLGVPVVAHQIGVPPVTAIASASHPEVLDGVMASTVPEPGRAIAGGVGYCRSEGAVVVGAEGSRSRRPRRRKPAANKQAALWIRRIALG